MENKNVAVLGIGALAFYYLIAKSKANDSEQSYSFGAGQGGVGAGSTFTLLENSGNTVSNINAPVYDTKKETTVINYSPTTNSVGTPAVSSSSGGGSNYTIPLSPSTSQALATYSAQDAQLKKSQAVYGLDNSAGGSYKFPAPTKSTYVPAQPTITMPTNSTSTKKESSTGSSGGGLLSSIGSAIGRLFGKK